MLTRLGSSMRQRCRHRICSGHAADAGRRPAAAAAAASSNSNTSVTRQACRDEPPHLHQLAYAPVPPRHEVVSLSHHQFFPAFCRATVSKLQQTTNSAGDDDSSKQHEFGDLTNAERLFLQEPDITETYSTLTTTDIDSSQRFEKHTSSQSSPFSAQNHSDRSSACAAKLSLRVPYPSRHVCVSIQHLGPVDRRERPVSRRQLVAAVPADA